MLRWGYQRLLRRVGSAKRDGIQAIGSAESRVEARHRLHELADLTEAIHGTGRSGRWISGKPAELPIHSDLTQARGAGDLIVGNVVNFERAGVDVAQDQVGRAGGMHLGNAG